MRTFFVRLIENIAGATPGEFGLMSSALCVAVMVFIGELGPNLVALFG